MLSGGYFFYLPVLVYFLSAGYVPQRVRALYPSESITGCTGQAYGGAAPPCLSGPQLHLGKRKNSWHSADDVPAVFARKRTTARRRWRAFVAKGIESGREPELVGGGLIRSVGGRPAV